MRLVWHRGTIQLTLGRRHVKCHLSHKKDALGCFQLASLVISDWPTPNVTDRRSSDFLGWGLFIRWVFKINAMDLWALHLACQISQRVQSQNSFLQVGLGFYTGNSKLVHASHCVHVQLRCDHFLSMIFRKSLCLSHHVIMYFGGKLFLLGQSCLCIRDFAIHRRGRGSEKRKREMTLT